MDLSKYLILGKIKFHKFKIPLTLNDPFSLLIPRSWSIDFRDDFETTYLIFLKKKSYRSVFRKYDIFSLTYYFILRVLSFRAAELLCKINDTKTNIFEIRKRYKGIIIIYRSLERIFYFFFIKKKNS